MTDSLLRRGPPRCRRKALTPPRSPSCRGPTSGPHVCSFDFLDLILLAAWPSACPSLGPMQPCNLFLLVLEHSRDVEIKTHQTHKLRLCRVQGKVLVYDLRTLKSGGEPKHTITASSSSPVVSVQFKHTSKSAGRAPSTKTKIPGKENNPPEAAAKPSTGPAAGEARIATAAATTTTSAAAAAAAAAAADASTTSRPSTRSGDEPRRTSLTSERRVVEGATSSDNSTSSRAPVTAGGSDTATRAEATTRAELLRDLEKLKAERASRAESSPVPNAGKIGGGGVNGGGGGGGGGSETAAAQRIEAVKTALETAGARVLSPAASVSASVAPSSTNASRMLERGTAHASARAT